MKKISFAIAATAVVAFIVPSVLAATVVGTKHDLSADLTSGTQVCAFCHTPHGSNVDAILANTAPLWNQDLSTVASYGSYTSDTFDATDIATFGAAVYAESLLCMSCHDGTVAPGTFYNIPNVEASNTTPSLAITGSALVGQSISDDHPVNFTYANSVTNGDGGLVAEAGIVAYLDTGALGGKIQCTSCHDPHDATGDANVDFMRASLDLSVLCTTCHSK